MDDSHDIKKGLTFPASPTKTHSSASSDEAMSPATTNDAAGADSGARTNRRFLIISAAVLALLIAVAVGLGVALGGTSASSDEKGKGWYPAVEPIGRRRKASTLRRNS